MKENGFILRKARSRRYPTETITDVDDPNTPTQAESLLHSLEQTARGIGFHVNAEETCTCVLTKKATSLL